MKDNFDTSQSTDSRGSNRLYLVILTAIISAFATLIIAISRLGKSKEPEIASQYAGINTSHPQPAAPLVVDRMSGATGLPSASASEPALAEQAIPMTTTRTIPASSTTNSQPEEMPPEQDQPLQARSAAPDAATRWSLPTKYVVGVGLFLTLLFVVYISRSSLGMIIFAALLAFVVQPAIDFFQRRWKMKRSPAIGLAYLLVVAAIILIPLVVIPAVIQSINDVLSMDWGAKGQEIATSLQAAAENTSSIPVIGPSISSALNAAALLVSGAATLPLPSPVVVDVSVSSIGGRLAESLGKLAKILGPLISAITSLIFMLLISLRISLSAHDMRAAYPRLIPPSYKNEVIQLVERILNIWVSFLRGQLSLMVVMGFLTYLLNLILGTPYPVFLGVIAGILEIIPNLGPVLATIPAVLFALFLGSSNLPVSNLVFAIIVILGYVLLSALENQVIVPRILGDAVDLPPLVVIVGCVIGGAAFGLLGVFLATPVISTSKEIASYLYNKILEPPPATEPPETKPSLMDTFRGLRQRIRLPFGRRDQSPEPAPSTNNKTEPISGP